MSSIYPEVTVRTQGAYRFPYTLPSVADPYKDIAYRATFEYGKGTLERSRICAWMISLDIEQGCRAR